MFSFNRDNLCWLTSRPLCRIQCRSIYHWRHNWHRLLSSHARICESWRCRIADIIWNLHYMLELILTRILLLQYFAVFTSLNVHLFSLIILWSLIWGQQIILNFFAFFVLILILWLNKSILMSWIVLTIILRTLNERSDLLMINNFTVFLEIFQA